MSDDCIYGWDLGGAHLKAAAVTAEGYVEFVDQLPCPLWRGISELDQPVAQVLSRSNPPVRAHAITMTGELVDAFCDRAQGVRALVNAFVNGAMGSPVRIYGGEAGFLSPRSALTHTAQVASANWLASATCVAQQLPMGILIDIGSTTTDLIPFADGQVLARGRDDRERMRHGELIYRGVVRTPVMVLADAVPFADDWAPLMAEHFATSADVYRLLGLLPEHADAMPAADHGPKTGLGSARRLARMLGMDAKDGDFETWTMVARYLKQCQLRQLIQACERQLSRLVLNTDAPIVGAGVGRFIARELALHLNRPYTDFGTLFRCADSQQFSVADCAPAVAVARLAGW